MAQWVIHLCSTWSLILQQTSLQGLKQQEGIAQCTCVSPVSAYITFTTVLVARAIHVTKPSMEGPCGRAWSQKGSHPSPAAIRNSSPWKWPVRASSSRDTSAVQFCCQMQRPLLSGSEFDFLWHLTPTSFPSSNPLLPEPPPTILQIPFLPPSSSHLSFSLRFIPYSLTFF